jgi:2-iminobutanoate/2-iminopropanoate deaminase
MPVDRINPDSLFKLDAFSQVVTATGGSGLAFIAGQGAFDKDLQLIGAGDLKAQTIQACRNLRDAVEAVGSSVDQVVSSTVHVVGLDNTSVGAITAGLAEALDGKPFPPHAMSLIGTTSLAIDGMLIEIVAVALIP